MPNMFSRTAITSVPRALKQTGQRWAALVSGTMNTLQPARLELALKVGCRRGDPHRQWGERAAVELGPDPGPQTQIPGLGGRHRRCPKHDPWPSLEDPAHLPQNRADGDGSLGGQDLGDHGWMSCPRLLSQARQAVDDHPRAVRSKEVVTQGVQRDV